MICSSISKACNYCSLCFEVSKAAVAAGAGAASRNLLHERRSPVHNDGKKSYIPLALPISTPKRPHRIHAHKPQNPMRSISSPDSCTAQNERNRPMQSGERFFLLMTTTNHSSSHVSSCRAFLAYDRPGAALGFREIIPFTSLRHLNDLLFLF